MIDRETVIKVAKLARLGMTEEDIETFGKQLSVILENGNSTKAFSSVLYRYSLSTR